MKDTDINNKLTLPKQIKQRIVLDEEVLELLENEKIFEEEKRQKNLKDFF